MNLTLHVWRQKDKNTPGKMVQYPAKNISPDMSFLEMLDVVNEELIQNNQEPIAFDHDCREGICGSCSLMINGVAHGPLKATTTCQLYMRHFKEGQHVYIEPWRAKAFPVLKDLVVDRTAMDRVMQAGGFVSVNTGGAPDANALPISKTVADDAISAAECIQCGACVASCKNASAMLFVSAKISHLALLPQGQPERSRRALKMVDQMDKEGFGNCTNQYECEAVCPKQVSVKWIAKMNREYMKSSICAEEETQHSHGDA
jgi:succinate dehydrogenase / fumarate reductase iron-sulfur subunit